MTTKSVFSEQSVGIGVGGTGPVDPKAQRPVRKGCEGTVAPVGPRKPVARNAVAIAFKADQAGGRDALAQLDEAVKSHR